MLQSEGLDYGITKSSLQTHELAGNIRLMYGKKFGDFSELQVVFVAPEQHEPFSGCERLERISQRLAQRL